MSSSNVTTIPSSSEEAPLSQYDFTKFAHIMAFPIGGNAMADMPLFNAIDAFVRNPANPLKEKAILLNHSQAHIMGIPLTVRQLNISDEEAVQEYLDGC